LLVLLGRSPRAVFADTLVSGTPALPPMAGLPSTMPSELLLRRPDLVRAQQRLAAAQARVEVARKAGWPSVNLAAGVGTEGARLSDLFSGPAFVWSLGASAAQTLFDSGRREAATDAARARQQQAVADWESALAQAFREVRDALSAQAAGEASARAQGERVAAQERVLALARLRFTNGVASQLDVLDAQRALQAARSALVAAEQARRNARIDLYKALGGGWSGLPPS
jgi:multidrug efflux system outer membrane protein